MKNKILAIDTSDHVCSVCISYDDVFISKSVGNKLNHSKTLMPLIEEAFREVDFNVNDLDYIYVTDGPGSFTGIRIGVCTAKALAHTNNTKIVPIKSLFTIASTINDFKDKIVVPLIDARRNTFYSIFYDSTIFNPITEIKHEEINTIINELSNFNKEIILVGDKLEELLSNLELPENFKIVDITNNINRAQYMIKNSSELLLNSNNIKTYKNIEPFYLKKSQAEREYEQKNGDK